MTVFTGNWEAVTWYFDLIKRICLKSRLRNLEEAQLATVLGIVRSKEGLLVYLGLSDVHPLVKLLIQSHSTRICEKALKHCKLDVVDHLLSEGNFLLAPK